MSERGTATTALYEGADGSPEDAPAEPVPMPRGTPAEPEARDRERGGIGDRLDSAVRRAGRFFHERSPRLRGQLRLCRSLYADAYVRARRARYNRRHPAPIDPYEVLWVDPDRIVRLSEPSNLPRFRRIGTVADGDWDRCALRFCDTDVFYAFRRHFEEGVAWEDTAFFRRIVEELESGEERWGCDSPSAFRRRCERLDQLYETIREQGFRSQRELYGSGANDPIDRRRATLSAHIINDEMAVDIGRDGELLFIDGRNRLAIAKVLDVEEVPVVVLRRHSQWVTCRDAAARYVERGGTLPEGLRNHPDIASFLESPSE